jgi:hypothetical protein
MKLQTCMATAILSCIGLCACIKKMSIQLPEFEPRLVLQSYTAIGDSFRVTVSKTISGTGYVPAAETYVENAVVVLYEGDKWVDVLEYDTQRHIYVSPDVRAVQGKVYRLTVAAYGFPEVEATTLVPVQVTASNVVQKKKARTTINGNELDDVTFSFQDPPLQNNYYLSALYPSRINSLHPSSMCVYTYDPVIDQAKSDLLPFDEGFCLESEEILFTDKSFNGSLKTITLSGDTYDLSAFYTYWPTVIHRPCLKLYSINEDYYNYLKRTISIGISNDEFFAFSNPVTPQGNVVNGFGIFTVYAVTIDSLDR